MKKILKIIAVAAAVLAALYAANQIIYFLAQKKRRPPKENFLFYRWRHGKVRYTVSGNPQAKPLLLVHGAGPGAGMHEWDRNIDDLARGHQVYALDLLGFGGSEKPGMGYSAYIYVTLINDFIRDVVGGKADFIGSGHGAAYGMMACYMEPHRFRRMLLVSPVGLGSARALPTQKHLWLCWILGLPIAGTFFHNMAVSRRQLRTYLRRMADGPADVRMLANCYDAAHAGGANARYAAVSYWTKFLNLSVEHTLQRIDTPMQMLWGENNQLNPASNAPPDMAPVIFRGCGAWPHRERPEEFRRAAADFFR